MLKDRRNKEDMRASDFQNADMTEENYSNAPNLMNEAQAEQSQEEISYYDNEGNLIDYSEYYDENGNLIDYSQYYDENGNLIDYSKYYDAEGNYIGTTESETDEQNQPKSIDRKSTRLNSSHL